MDEDTPTKKRKIGGCAATLTLSESKKDYFKRILIARQICPTNFTSENQVVNIDNGTVVALDFFSASSIQCYKMILSLLKLEKTDEEIGQNRRSFQNAVKSVKTELSTLSKLSQDEFCFLSSSFCFSFAGYQKSAGRPKRNLALELRNNNKDTPSSSNASSIVNSAEIVISRGFDKSVQTELFEPVLLNPQQSQNKLTTAGAEKKVGASKKRCSAENEIIANFKHEVAVLKSQLAYEKKMSVRIVNQHGRYVTSVKTKNQFQSHKIRFFQDKGRKAEKKVKALNSKIVKLEERCAENVICIQEIEEELIQAKKKLEQYDEGVFQLKERQAYTDETVAAVIELQSLGVSDENMGPVLRCVASLLNFKLPSVPSASSCRNFAIASLNLAKLHVKHELEDALEKNENFCLASDETTKNSTKMQAYGVSREGGTFLFLGIEQVAEKSAATAFKSLSDLVNDLPSSSNSFFDKFALNVKSTISDSASTETKFNKILEQYRGELLPKIRKDWTSLTKTEQDSFSRVSNFFCQLHVLSNYTKIVVSALSQHETIKKKLQKLDEPTVLTLIKMVAKLFGERSAGLHGIVQLWRGWLSEKGEVSFSFPSFLGHRFNIMFVIAARVFFYFDHLKKFCDEFGHAKPELKEVRLLLEDPLIAAHLQIIGLCDQYITGPLWRLVENSSHVLETCVYSLQLKVWLEQCETFPGAFFDGTSATPSLADTSPSSSGILFAKLLAVDPSECTLEAVSLVIRVSLDYFSTQFSDYLPNGKFCGDKSEIWGETSCATGTNVQVESFFGFITHSFLTRPNMTLARREALALVKKNHTILWFSNLPADVQKSYIQQSRAKVSETRDLSVSKRIAVENEILRIFRQKNQEFVKKEANQLNLKRRLTEDLLRYGFWQSGEDVQEFLNSCTSEKEKFQALSSQIRYRQRVMQQEGPTKNFFSLSVKGQKLKVDDLVKKVLELIEHCKKGDFLLSVVHDFSGRKVKHVFFDLDGKKSNYFGVVERVHRFKNGPEMVVMKYENETVSHSLTLEEFESGISSGDITFLT